MFHAHAKDTELVIKLSFKIYEVIAKKGKVYSDGEFMKSCLKLFTRREFSNKKCIVEQLSLPWSTVARTKFVSNK